MKKIFFSLIVLSISLFGFNEFDGIALDKKDTTVRIMNALGLPKELSSNKKMEFYNKLEPFLINDWSLHWTTNKSVLGTKTLDSSTRVIDIIIYNNERITNITFVYFKNQNEIFVSTKEFIEEKSQNVISLYSKTASDNNYTKGSEGDNYAYFSQKGFLAYNGYHLRTPIGMLLYKKVNIIDLD